MKEELIKKVIAGDQAAIKKLYQKYQPRLLNFILLKVRRREDAEEILQEIMISTLDSLPLFKGKCSLYTFICSIAKHEIADFYRKKKIKTFVFSRLPQLESLVSQAFSPERVLEEREFKKEILKTLKSLTEGYSKILRLKYIDDLSYKEIAKKLKKSAKAVESKLARARNAFTKAYLSSYSS